MMNCAICGKKFFTAYPQNWPYRYKQKIFCSEDCRIVHAARDLHKIEFITLEDRDLIPAAKTKRENRKEKEDMRVNKLLKDEEKAKAVEIALEGGDPIAYLKECGCGNPWGNWGYIKMKMQKKNPEQYERIMEAEKKRKEKSGIVLVPAGSKVVTEMRQVKAEVQVAEKLPKEAAEQPVKKVAPPPEPVENLTIPGLEVLRFKVTGIETNYGKFYHDEESGQFRWMPKGSTIVVMMQAADWAKMAEDLPEILRVLGVRTK